MDTRINPQGEANATPEHADQQAGTESRAAHRTRWRGRAVAVLATVIALNLGIVIGMVAKSTQPAIVAFDMKGTLDQFLTQSASQSLTEAQSMQLAERFSAALDASLNDYQHAHQALILVSPSVVRGAPDITLTIQRDIAARMREGTQ